MATQVKSGSSKLSHPVLDALSAHIAILDASGTILAVNRAWEKFACRHDAGTRFPGVGDNYLAVCDRAVGAEQETAGAIAQGIREVAAGLRREFCLEYPWHSPTENRWFMARVTRYEDMGEPRIVVAHENTTAARLAEQELCATSRMLEALADASPAAIVMTDSRGLIRYWSPAAESIFGWSRAEALGCPAPSIGCDGRRETERFLRAVLEGRSFNDVEVRRTGRDGELIDLSISAASMHDALGQVTGAMAIITDISARKRAEEAQQRQLRAEETLRAMERVLGIVGHELRTPLAALRAMSEYLLTDEARNSAELDLFLRSINHEVVRMADMANDLLEGARLNSGRARWNWSTFPLATPCHEAVDTVRPLVHLARVELICEVDPPALEMRGDVDAVRRLVMNLVNNAARHTRRGVIRVSSRAAAGEHEWIEIVVEDTGEGMTSRVVADLGQAFALNGGVVDVGTMRGTGLGLAICKGIAAAHGGQLTIDSLEGAGTRVTVRLRADLPAPLECVDRQSSREVLA